MLYEIPYWKMGFTDSEWDEMSATAKRIIRDFVLNGRSLEETEKFCFYETDFSIRRTVKKYNILNRPALVIRAEDLCLQ